MALASLQVGQTIKKDGALYSVLGNAVAGSGVGFTAFLTASKAYDEKAVAGVWLLMFLSAPDAAALAVDGGEPPEDLHLTIGALDPETTRGKQDLINSILALAADQLPPVLGKIGGIGQFTSDGKIPVVALFDSLFLNAWRDALLGTLKAIGVELLSDHGYTPHVTLAYVDDPLEQLPPVDGMALELGTLSLVWEGDRQDFQLTGMDVKGLYLTSFMRDGRQWAGPDIDAESFEEAERKISEVVRVAGELVAEWEIKGGPGSGHYGHQGRPGVRGGSTPGTNDPVHSVLRSLEKSMLNETLKDGNERGAIVSLSDGTVLQESVGVGKSVKFDVPSDIARRTGYRAMVLTHTHVTPITFSQGDIATFASNSQLREMRVVDSSGKLYVMRKPPRWDPTSKWGKFRGVLGDVSPGKAVSLAVLRQNRKYSDRYYKALADGVPEEEAHHDYHNLIMPLVIEDLGLELETYD